MREGSFEGVLAVPRGEALLSLPRVASRLRCQNKDEGASWGQPSDSGSRRCCGFFFSLIPVVQNLIFRYLQNVRKSRVNWFVITT